MWKNDEERTEWIFFSSLSLSLSFLFNALFGFSLACRVCVCVCVCSLGNYREQEKQRKNISYIIRFISSYYQLRLITAGELLYSISSRLIALKVFDVHHHSCGSRQQHHRCCCRQHFQDRKLFYWKRKATKTPFDMSRWVSSAIHISWWQVCIISHCCRSSLANLISLVLVVPVVKPICAFCFANIYKNNQKQTIFILLCFLSLRRRLFARTHEQKK